MNQERGPTQLPDHRRRPGGRELVRRHQEAMLPAYPVYYPSEGEHGGQQILGVLLRLLNALIKHRLLVGLILAGCVGFAILFTLLSTPMFRATSTIQIEREQANVTSFEGLETREGARPEFFRTQYELLRSRALAGLVVTELGLVGVDPKRIATRSLFSATLSAIFSVFKSDEASEATVELAESAARLEDLLHANVDIEPVALSQIVGISFAAPDPEMAAKIANGYAEAFIRYNLARKVEATAYAKKFLEEQLALAKAKLEESERAAVEYAQAEQITDIVNVTSTLEARLAQLSQQLTETTAQRIQAEEERRVAQSGGGATAAVMNSPEIQALRQQLAQLEIQYNDKLRIFLPEHPEILELAIRISGVKQQIAAEISRIQATMANSVEMLVGREAALAAEIDSVNVELFALRDRGIRYSILRREADTNRTLYEGLLQRYKEIGAAGAIGISNVSIVDRAGVPTSASSPSLIFNLLLAILAGCGLSVIAVIALEQLDDTIKSLDEVEGSLALTPLGLLPQIKAPDTIEAALRSPRSNFAEAVRSIRTAIQFSFENGAPRTISVTSARPGDGKSTAALAIARSFAEMGVRSVIVDADMRKPTLHAALNLANDGGLSAILTGEQDWTTQIIETDLPNLHAIPAGPYPGNPAELLGSEHFQNLIAALEAEYDFVCIDSPPVIGLADAPLIGSAVHSFILVAGAARTSKRSIRGVLRRMAQANAQALGLVLNWVDLDKRTFGYGEYGYGYGYGYGSYGYGGGRTETYESPFKYGVVEEGDEAYARRMLAKRLVRRDDRGPGAPPGGQDDPGLFGSGSGGGKEGGPRQPRGPNTGTRRGST